MLVRPGYFSKLYVKHARWAELWKECARLDYTPIVDVRVIRDRRGDGQPLRGVIAETLKYAVKPEDMMDREWLLGLTSQVHRMKFFGSGGILKELLRLPKVETDEDLLLFGDSGEYRSPKLFFTWNRELRRYLKVPHPCPRTSQLAAHSTGVKGAERPQWACP